MISNKIKEIVEQREKSFHIDYAFKERLKRKSYKDDRKPLSETIRKNNGISIISEIKPASPTLGDIRKDINIKKLSTEMENAGVVGLSVLTEPNYFLGSYDNLLNAVVNTKLPCLMKDFVINSIQFEIASSIGATNILLINAICDLEEMFKEASSYGLEPLIEIHDFEEIKDIINLLERGFKPNLIGVNNRNLKTLEIDLNISLKIIPQLRKEFGEKIQIISESGINTIKDIKLIQPSGADAFLIGSSIMQSDNIREKILKLRGLK